MGFLVYTLELALALYLVLAVGVNFVALLAPVNRKPLLNAALLGLVVIAFFFAVAIKAVSS